MKFEFTLPMRILKNDALAEVICELSFIEVIVTADLLTFGVNGVEQQTNAKKKFGRGGEVIIEFNVPWEALKFSESNNFFTIGTKDGQPNFHIRKCQVLIEQVPNEEFILEIEP